MYQATHFSARASLMVVGLRGIGPVKEEHQQKAVKYRPIDTLLAGGRGLVQVNTRMGYSN